MVAGENQLSSYPDDKENFSRCLCPVIWDLDAFDILGHQEKVKGGLDQVCLIVALRCTMRIRNTYIVNVLLFILLFGSYVYVMPRWADWNQNSRLNLVLAIVDDGVLYIDKYYQNTGDYAFFNGRYYSDKAPGLSFLAVPVYAAVRPILHTSMVQEQILRLAESGSFHTTLNATGSGVAPDKVYYALVLYIVTAATVALPSALLGVILFRFLTRLTGSHSIGLLAALLFGLATNAAPYSGSFFAHQLVACLLFGAFSLALAIKEGRAAPAWSVAVGLMLGYAVISEYPTALIAAAVFLYTCWALPDRRWIGGLIAGGLPPGILLAVYDYAIFGNILPIGYAYSALYTDIHHQGLISIVGPRLDALWGISFGAFRGLFFVAPILLLALPGFVLWWRSGVYRQEAAVSIWAVSSFFLFNGSSVMWHGGFSIGPRYLLPMLPFMAVGLAVALKTMLTSFSLRLIVFVLGAWSVAVIWIQTLGGQNFPDWSSNPLLQYSLPRLSAGDIARNLGMVLGLQGAVSLVPLVVAILCMLSLLLWHLQTLHRSLVSMSTLPPHGDIS